MALLVLEVATLELHEYVLPAVMEQVHGYSQGHERELVIVEGVHDCSQVHAHVLVVEEEDRGCNWDHEHEVITGSIVEEVHGCSWVRVREGLIAKGDHGYNQGHEHGAFVTIHREDLGFLQVRHLKQLHWHPSLITSDWVLWQIRYLHRHTQRVLSELLAQLGNQF